MGKPELKKVMVNVGFIGGERILIFQNTRKEYANGVVNRNHHNANGDGRGRTHGPGALKTDIKFVELDGHHRHNKPQQQGAGVAHKNLISLSINIETKEGQQGPHQRCRHDGPVVLTNQVKPGTKGD